MNKKKKAEINAFYEMYKIEKGEKMKYPEDRIVKVDEARELLEQEFRERILKKYPDIDANRFMDLVEAFLRGYDKGIGIMHNIFYPDFKVCVFDDDGIEEYKYKKKC